MNPAATSGGFISENKMVTSAATAEVQQMPYEFLPQAETTKVSGDGALDGSSLLGQKATFLTGLAPKKE